MRDFEVIARCQKKTAAVCYVSGRRFKIVDLDAGLSEVPFFWELLHPDMYAIMPEEERQAAYAKVQPRELAAFDRERERLISLDEAAARERESAAAAERAREAADSEAVLSPPASP